MGKVKPWLHGPLELLRHAEEHLESGGEFDRRMALVSYDNSIEVSITTFLQLHPDQRDGKTFAGDDVRRWLKSFHTQIEFLEEYVKKLNEPMRVTRDEFIWYHKRRSKLYHEESGSIPPERDIQGVREAALWVFSILFGEDAEDLLARDTPPPSPAQDQRLALSGEMAVLDQLVVLGDELNILLKARGLIGLHDRVDIREAWNLLVAETSDSPEGYAATIEKAGIVRDAIVKGDIPQQSEEDLHQLSEQLRQTSELIETRLRAFQHQIVNDAVAATIRAASSHGNRRAGVVSQATGSGRGLTMLAYIVQLIQQPELVDSLIVVVSGRNEIDTQARYLLESYAESLSSQAVQATSRSHLKRILDAGGTRIVFTTVHKLIGTKHSVLSARHDLVVVANDIAEHADYLRNILPNATFILFTGIPLKREVSAAAFGEVVGQYNLEQAVADGLRVPIHIERPAIDLTAAKEDWDRMKTEFSEIAEGHKVIDSQALNNLETCISASGRSRVMAKDIVNHFESRLQTQVGKGMIVTTSRRSAADLYNEIVRLRPEWHDDSDEEGEIKAVMTGSPQDSSELQPHVRANQQLSLLLRRFKDPDDPLKLVITSGLWLTGVDVPPLHTLYINRPMSEVGLLQVIARVGTPFEGKQDGIVVDYWGLDLPPAFEPKR